MIDGIEEGEETQSTTGRRDGSSLVKSVVTSVAVSGVLNALVGDQQGPAGKDGLPGRDGRDGVDGVTTIETRTVVEMGGGLRLIATRPLAYATMSSPDYSYPFVTEVVKDVLGEFDASAGTFTVKRAGVLRFSAWCQSCRMSGSAAKIVWCMYKNEVGKYYMQMNTAGSPTDLYTMQFGGVIDVLEGDVLRLGLSTKPTSLFQSNTRATLEIWETQYAKS